MKRTVTAIIPGHERLPGACEIYRITMPLHYIRKHGWEGQWLYAETLRAGGPKLLMKLVAQTDIFVVPRLVANSPSEEAALEALFDVIRSAGRKIVYEVDDDYTNEHRTVHHGDMVAVASMCDAITVTTPLLANLMTKRSGRPAYVLPNMLDPILFRNGSAPRATQPGKIIISLTGSSTHYEDWKVLRDVLPEIAERDDVRIVIGGFTPDYLEKMPNTDYIKPVNYHTYAQIIRGSDVILAPVDPADGFNHGKSPIKAVEGMGATRSRKGIPMGAAVLASDYPVYRLAIQSERNGLLVPHTPSEWRKAILRVLDDAALRDSIRRRAWKDAWKHYDISRGTRKWAEAYSDILKLPEIL